jgi:hypothetical protein
MKLAIHYEIRFLSFDIKDRTQLKEFSDMVLRKIYGREEVTGCWRTPHTGNSPICIPHHILLG